MIIFPGIGAPADTGYTPPPGNDVRFPAWTAPPPVAFPPVVFPGLDAPTDTGYTPPPGDDTEFPFWLYAPDLQPPITFPGTGAPGDTDYTPPQGDVCDFPAWYPPPISLGKIYATPWAGKRARGRTTKATWRNPNRRQPQPASAPWSTAQTSAKNAALPWPTQAPANSPARPLQWQHAALAKSPHTSLPWTGQNPAHANPAALPWGAIKDRAGNTALRWSIARIADTKTTAIVWGLALPTACNTIIPWGGDAACNPTAKFPWFDPAKPDPNPSPLPWPIEPKPIYAVPDEDTYIMTHDIYLIRSSDGKAIPINGLTISIDADSWAWGLSAGIIGQQALADLASAGSDEGLLVEVGINGYRWEFLAEQTSESQQFPGSSITLTGRSQSAKLAAPYTLPRDHTSTALTTAQQLAIEELPLTGWTLTWNLIDWPVTAGAWTYQGITAMDAISRLAQAAGGILQSDRTGQAITVQPRRKVWPWNYPATPADYLIPWDACITTARLSRPSGSPNAIYVHGGEHGGILARVALATSAGDKGLPVVVNDLLTDTIPARELGGKLLAEQQPPCKYKTATIPITAQDGSFPLMEIGQLVSIGDSEGDQKGICTTLSISVQAVGNGYTVRQQASLDDGPTTNPYTRLRALTPQPPVLVGTVTSQSGSSVIVDLIGGGKTTVKGTATNGTAIYIQSGRILGPAPSLTQTEITV